MANVLSPCMVISHVSALWYHRFAAMGLLQKPHPCEASCKPIDLSHATEDPTRLEIAGLTRPIMKHTELSMHRIYSSDEIQRYMAMCRARSHLGEPPPRFDEFVALSTKSLEFPKPLDLLCGNEHTRHWRGRIHSHLCNFSLPSDALWTIGNGIYVSSPAFTVMQLARTLKEPHLIAALITELAGRYVLLPSGYECCSRYVKAGKPPYAYGRLQSDGYVKCAPTLVMQDLERLVQQLPKFRGNRFVLRSLSASGSGSESPFETAVGVELQLQRRYGGIGAGQARLNQKIIFSPEERKLAGGRYSARADILFSRKDGVRIDVEPGGVFGHAGREAMDSDRRRRHALEHARIEVVDITWDEYSKEETWRAIGRRITDHLMKHYPSPSKTMLERQQMVHKDLCNWNCLRTFPPSAWRHLMFPTRFGTHVDSYLHYYN